MKKNRSISLEEQKKIRYEMLVEVDEFCRKNAIKYSLAFGTLLGAVRHQGFIPWDDDLDIMMPLPDMLRLKKEFRSDKISFCDIDTESNYRCAFANLGYNSTYRKEGLISSFFGVGIDVYPIIGLPEDTKLQNSFFDGAELLHQKRIQYLKWQSRLTRAFPIKTIPGYEKTIREFRDYLYNNSVPYHQACVFYVIAGPFSLKEKMTYTCDLFKEVIELPFEGKSFICIKDYDYFLKLRYGDYMQLPPIEERVPHHGQIYFWK